MANRRSFNSSGQRTSPTVLFIVLVSCLASSHCASYLSQLARAGQPARRPQLWRQQHDYQILASKEDNLDDLYGQLQNSPLDSRPSARPLSPADGLLAIEQQQQPAPKQTNRPAILYGLPALVKSRQTPTDNDDLYRRLLQERQVAADDSVEPDAEYEFSSILRRQPDEPVDSETLEVDSRDLETKLMLLLAQRRQQQQRQHQQLPQLVDSSDRYVDPKVTDSFAADQKQDPTVADDVADSFDRQLTGDIVSSVNLDSKRSAPRGIVEDERRNFTTLLEDENQLEPTNETNKVVENATDFDESFGTILARPLADLNQANKQPQINETSIGDILGRLYKSITKYLPFKDEIGILRQPEAQQASNSNTSRVVVGELLPAKEDLENTKQRVSIQVVKSAANSTHENAEANRIRGNDKRFRDRMPTTVVNDEDDAQDIELAAESSAPVGTVVVGDDQPSDNNKKAATTTNDKHRVSLLRQSSLVMPLKSNDELVVRTTTTHEHPDSLLHKYIYAPTHHFYLNTMGGGSSSKLDDSITEEEQFASSGAYARRLHPGDQVFGSYEGQLKPFYSASQKDVGNMNMMLNKTNDVYFLIMVGAFCAMASAVVLAAGLFVYRVQQNRKTSAETDYPTYGVVGPSTLTGKCGAAPFGGYFGAGHPGSAMNSVNGSKTGSVKHLVESASGDSGIAATDKSNSKGRSSSANPNSKGAGNYTANQNAARMYHYQHQKQQMIFSDRASTGRHTSASDLDSEDENDEGSYTVYECPGLASAHEMEIKNPLFNDDQTP